MTIPKHIVSLIRDAYFVSVLVLTTGAFASLFLSTDDLATASQGSPFLKAFSALIYGVVAVRIFLRRSEAFALLRENKALAFFLLLALGSALWSIDPNVSLHNWATLFGSTLIGLDLSIHYTLQKQLRLVCTALVFLTVLSVFVELVTPGLIPGQELEGTAWHGVFGVKNVFGRMLCLTVIVCLSAFRRSTMLKVITIAVGATLAILSQSTSSLGYMAIMISAFALLPILKWTTAPRRIAICGMALGALLSVYMVSQNFDTVTAALDKDPHLTGRVDLWEYAIDSIKDKPVLGYGYQAFWTYDSVPARRIREAINWDSAPHAHNGYIDLTLELGLVGLIAYLVLLTTYGKRAYAYFMKGPEDYRRWPLTLLAFTVFYQFTESSTAGAGCMWIIFCGVTLSLNEDWKLAVVENDKPSQATRFRSPLSIDVH